MTIIEIAQLPNGAHNNQTVFNAVIPIPEGWALLLPDVATSETENFPFANIETKTISRDEAPDGMDLTIFGDRDHIDVVTKWDPLPVPEPEPMPEPTPSQKREQAYNTEEIIDYEGKKLTVTAAAQLWEYYAAEGSPKAEELTKLIAEAKAEIRKKYPDENE